MRRKPFPLQPGAYADECYGEAYERAQEASEFGLPENYDDPLAYHGKTPPCDDAPVGYGGQAR